MANHTGFIKMAVGALVVVLVAAGVIMPILASAEQTHATFTNDGYYRMSETSEETVIFWDPTDPQKITVNDAEVSLTSLATFNASYSLAFADDFILRYFYTSAANQSIQLWNSAYVVGTGISNGVTLTVTINDEGITWLTSAEGATASTYTHAGAYFVADNDGAYIMKNKDAAAYVATDSTIVYAAGISGITTSNYSGFYFEGTVDDLTVTPMNSNVTISDVAATYEAVDGYIGLSSLSKVTFTSSYTSGGTTTETNQTYSYFLVPYQVTAELAEHPTGTVLTLIQILPVLIMVGVLMFIVSAFISNRRA